MAAETIDGPSVKAFVIAAIIPIPDALNELKASINSVMSK